MKAFTKYRLIVILIFIAQIHFAAIRVPQIRFLKDSVMLGEPIQVSMSYKHDPNIELLFPDSTYNYFPFEYISRKYFHTKSDSLFDTDSAVYTLSTFELARRLELSVPVFVFINGDTSMIFSNGASVWLKEEITPATPPDSLHVNARFMDMSSTFNYPYFIIGSGIFVLVSGIILLFFRKRIIREYKLYFMKKDYDKFISKYIEIQHMFTAAPSTSLLEDLLSVWKKYLEKLEKVPYTTLTTKEISTLLNINQLTSSLQNFDRAIYGGFIKEDLENSMNYLKDTAKTKFIQKTQSIKNV
ncbi:MAG: hypothetical protein SFY32_10380 [Bacteroidota bacterium]|nr:hypothetical protein [Bacteroidota bacterium]